MKKLLAVWSSASTPFGQPGERIVRGDDMEAAGSGLPTNSEATLSARVPRSDQLA